MWFPHTPLGAEYSTDLDIAQPDCHWTMKDYERHVGQHWREARVNMFWQKERVGGSV